MEFRLSTKNDTDIYQIYKENHISLGGQLVSEFNHPGTITYVAEDEGKIIAYVNIMERLPERIIAETKFGDKRYLFKENALYIRQVAVDRGYQNKGIGKEFYRELQKRYPDTPFYAFVDIRNAQSLKFHIRNGFFPIGIYAVPQFSETRNYTAFLFVRD